MHFVATCRHFVRCNKFFFSVFVNCMGVTCYLADMPGWLGPVFSQASQYITNLSNLHHMLPLNWLVNKGTHGGYLWVFCSPNVKPGSLGVCHYEWIWIHGSGLWWVFSWVNSWVPVSNPDSCSALISPTNPMFHFPISLPPSFPIT